MEKVCERMYIDKFGGVVKINIDHPLAIAQRAKGATAPAAGGGDPVSTVSNGTGTAAKLPPAGSSADQPTLTPLLPPEKLQRLTVDALKGLCAERKIEVPAEAPKRVMVDLLTAWKAPE